MAALKHSLAIAVAFATLANSPAQSGDVGAGILGGVIGGVVGSVITNSVNQNRQQQPQTVVREREVIVERERPRTVYVDRTPRQTIDPYTREENRRTQVALNYFGFNAGAPDGVLGGRSRGAIQAFQAYMNFPATGYLTPQELGFLNGAYDRAVAEGPTTMQIAASSPQGVRAVLPYYYSGVLPQGYGVQPQPIVPSSPFPQQVAVAPQTQVAALAPQPAPTPEPAAAPEPAAPAGLPLFTSGPIEASMSSFCARIAPAAVGVSLQEAALSSDGEYVLASQFCAVRAEALSESDRLAGTIQGVTRSEMQRQCEAFAPTMDRYVATLVGEGAPAAKAALQAYAVGSGVPLQALAANSRICLGVGYGADNSRVTLASAMILVGIGESSFGETLAYHLAYGFGAPENRARSAEWLDDAAAGLAAGARPAVANAGAERPQLLLAMASRLRGAPAQAPATQEIAAPPAAGGFQMPGVPEPKKQL